MQTKIQKWGNSQGLRLTKVLLEEIQAAVGDEVKLYTHEGKIVIEPIKPVRKKYDLKDLIAGIPKDYKTKEVNWSKPVGKEEW